MFGERVFRDYYQKMRLVAFCLSWEYDFAQGPTSVSETALVVVVPITAITIVINGLQESKSESNDILGVATRKKIILSHTGCS